MKKNILISIIFLIKIVLNIIPVSCINGTYDEDNLYVYYSSRSFEYRDSLNCSMSIEFSLKAIEIDSLNVVNYTVIAENYLILDDYLKAKEFIDKAFYISKIDKTINGIQVKGSNPRPYHYLRRLEINERLGNNEAVQEDLKYLNNIELTDYLKLILALYYARNLQEQESYNLLKQIPETESFIQLGYFYNMFYNESIFNTFKYWEDNKYLIKNDLLLFEGKKIMKDIQDDIWEQNDLDIYLIAFLIYNEIENKNISYKYINHAKYIIKEKSINIKKHIEGMKISEEKKQKLSNIFL